MSFVESLTDDQLALLGCGLALVGAFTIMSLTWTVRQAVTGETVSSDETRTVPLREETQKRHAA